LQFVAIVSFPSSFISSTYLSAAPFSTLPPGHPSVGSFHFFIFSGSHSAMPALPLRHKTWIKVKSAFLRITLTRVTATFFLFSFIHCFAQGIIQAYLYKVDYQYSALTFFTLDQAHLPQNQFVYLTGIHPAYQLHLCDDVPYGQPRNVCTTIFDTGNPTAGLGSTTEAPHNSSNSPPAPPSSSCIHTLMYAGQVFTNFKREDGVLIALQFWLFAISYIAIMYDSIPHTLAVFFARVLVTAWSVYTIWRTKYSIQDEFQRLIIDPDTPCNYNYFGTYFTNRITFEIPDVILNLTALVLSGILSWRLLKTYKTHSFKSLGAPPKIIRIYKYFMAVLVCLQLGVFVLVTSMALWVNQLMTTAIAKLSLHTAIYDAVFLFTTILLIPWITTGWYGIRCENKRLMTLFLVLALLFVAAWATMFYSQVYRWTFLQWTFLACMSTASFIVIIASMILGTISWLNFDQGLANYLHAEDALASSDFEPEVFPHDVEKDFVDKLAAYSLPTLHFSDVHKDSASV
jgi:hypothetical protein